MLIRRTISSQLILKVSFADILSYIFPTTYLDLKFKATESNRVLVTVRRGGRKNPTNLIGRGYFPIRFEVTSATRFSSVKRETLNPLAAPFTPRHKALRRPKRLNRIRNRFQKICLTNRTVLYNLQTKLQIRLFI